MSQPAFSPDSRFEDILEGLKGVVDQLEQGDLPLEQSLQLFETGMKLSQLGTQRLDEAESRIEHLLEGQEDLEREEAVDTRGEPDE